MDTPDPVLEQAIQLLMSAASSGIRPYVDGLPTPNRNLCIEVAKKLYDSNKDFKVPFNMRFSRELSPVSGAAEKTQTTIYESCIYRTMAFRWTQYATNGGSSNKSILEQAWVTSLADVEKVNQFPDSPWTFPFAWKQVQRVLIS